MITQELLDFIKQELQAGMTKDQVSQLLQVNGWHPSDIDEAFVHFAPPTQPQPAVSSPKLEPINLVMQQPVAQPQLRPQPQPQPLSQPVAATAPVQPRAVVQSAQPMTSAPKHSFRNPSFIMGILALLVASIIGGVLLSVIPRTAIFPVAGTALIEWGMVILFIGSLIGAVILNMITRIFQFEGASFGKASTFEAIKVIVLLALAALMSVGLPSVVVAVAAVVLMFAILCFYYGVSLLKAIYVFIFGLGFGVFLAMIIGLVAAALGIGFSALNLFIPHASMSMNMIQTNVVNQAQVQNSLSPQPNVPSTNTSAVNPSDIPTAEQAFPAGILFPESSQVTSLNIVTLSSSKSPVVTMTYMQSDTLQNLAAGYTAALKKDGYAVPTLPLGPDGSWVIEASKKTSDGNLANISFVIREVSGMAQVNITIIQ